MYTRQNLVVDLKKKGTQSVSFHLVATVRMYVRRAWHMQFLQLTIYIYACKAKGQIMEPYIRFRYLKQPYECACGYRHNTEDLCMGSNSLYKFKLAAICVSRNLPAKKNNNIKATVIRIWMMERSPITRKISVQMHVFLAGVLILLYAGSEISAAGQVVTESGNNV